MAKLSKEEIKKRLAEIPEDVATPEEIAIFEKAEKELKDGTYEGVPYEKIKASGKIALRLPPSLHKELIYLSNKENVSLNQYLVYGLARFAESQKK